MCELFGMSTRRPGTVTLSLEEFSRHGGLSGPHKDGWGIAWYEDRDIRLVKEAFPAAGSACVRFVQEHPFRSPLVVSHVRRATQGQVATRNWQPFIRELGGAWHSFAHKRRQADGTIRAPGLWRLARHCDEGGELVAQGLSVAAHDGEQDVPLVASVPLTGEAWVPLPEGSVLAARLGRVVADGRPACPDPALQVERTAQVRNT